MSLLWKPSFVSKLAGTSQFCAQSYAKKHAVCLPSGICTVFSHGRITQTDRAGADSAPNLDFLNRVEA